MNPSTQQIRGYYDQEIRGKLKGFIEGNPRVERAWDSIVEWVPKDPKRILEIGCGIGDVSWRMSKYWPSSKVLGIDISPKSIFIAKQLFGSENLHFSEHDVSSFELFEKEFDLIILVDVYEHISRDSRPHLHGLLREALTSSGRIFLSCPTPRKQDNLKQLYPESLQPVDEDIDLQTIQTLAEDIGLKILLYKEVNIWNVGDYLHAVLGNHTEWEPTPPLTKSEKVSRKLANIAKLISKFSKVRRVERRLGKEFRL